MNFGRRERGAQKGATRRQFIGGAVGFFIAATIGGVFYPIANYVRPPSRRRVAAAGERILAGTMDQIPSGAAKKIVINNKPALAINTGKAVRCFSAICTHLGCIAYWKDKEACIQCPCHDGRYDTNGQVITGPPPRALPEYEVAIKDGKIYVGTTPNAPLYG